MDFFGNSGYSSAGSKPCVCSWPTSHVTFGLAGSRTAQLSLLSKVVCGRLSLRLYWDTYGHNTASVHSDGRHFLTTVLGTWLLINLY